MQFGKVIGNVVAAKKVENLTGLTLMVVEYLDDKLNSSGKSAVCTDSVSAGKGDIVLLCSSSSARLTSRTKNVCTDNTIVGIVDSVSASGKYLYNTKDGVN